MSATEAKLLKKLSPTQAKALKLKSEGHTRRTAAELLGVSPNHIKNLWQDARRRAAALGLPLFREVHARTARVHRLSAIDG